MLWTRFTCLTVLKLSNQTSFLFLLVSCSPTNFHSCDHKTVATAGPPGLDVNDTAYWLLLIVKKRFFRLTTYSTMVARTSHDVFHEQLVKMLFQNKPTSQDGSHGGIQIPCRPILSLCQQFWWVCDPFLDLRKFGDCVFISDNGSRWKLKSVTVDNRTLRTLQLAGSGLSQPTDKAPCNRNWSKCGEVHLSSLLLFDIHQQFGEVLCRTLTVIVWFALTVLVENFLWYHHVAAVLKPIFCELVWFQEVPKWG